MWRELFTAPWPDEENILPPSVQEQATARIYSYWRARGWHLLLGEMVLWAGAYSWHIPHPNAYGVLVGSIALIYVLGLLPAQFTTIWLGGSVGLLMLHGMLVDGLGATTAFAYLMPYTFAGMLLSGYRRIVIQAWCVVAFWISLFYEIPAWPPQLHPPRTLLVCYNILLAAFVFQTLRFLNHFTVEINTVYVEEKVRQQSHQFLARVSHELRTPLNSVLGFAKLLRRADLTAAQQMYLDQIVDEGTMLNRLVSDLLDSAHLSTGKLTLKPTECDINAVCTAVIEEHRPNLVDSVVLQAHLAPSLPPFFGDDMRLRQALGNLVANAIKHTRQGTITVTTQQQDNAICIRVSDTGPGIPEDQQKLIFVPFVQLDSHSAGVGLGLDIALQLVRLHGGDIHLESVVGQGSTFTITLPLDTTLTKN